MVDVLKNKANLCREVVFGVQIAKKCSNFQQSVNMGLFLNDNNICLTLHSKRLSAGLVPANATEAYGDVVCESGTLFQL